MVVCSQTQMIISTNFHMASGTHIASVMIVPILIDLVHQRSQTMLRQSFFYDQTFYSILIGASSQTLDA